MTADVNPAILECFEDTQTPHGSSKWYTYAACPERHHLKYEEGISTVYARPKYFGVGSICHAVLQYVQKGIMVGEARNWEDIVNYAATLPDQELSEVHEASRLMAAYWLQWGTDNAGWHEQAEIVSVEEYLEADRCDAADKDACLGCAGDPIWPYTARADTILRLGGEVTLADTKTRSVAVPGIDEFGETVDPDALGGWKAEQAVNPQFLGLAYLVQKKYGLTEPPGILVNCIIKTKKPKFARPYVRITQAAVDAWAANQKEVARHYHNDKLTGRNRLRVYQSCSAIYGRCEYFRWCHGSEESRMKHYKQETKQ